jgi:hypothetical protein
MTATKKLLAGLALLALVIAFQQKPVLRAPFLAGACYVGVGRACVGAAWLFGPKTSNSLLSHGCEKLKHANSCAILTDLIATGLAGPPDYARAERMCLQGDHRFGEACMHLARLTIMGQFGDYEQEKRTEAFFRQACALGMEEGCRSGATARTSIQLMNRFNNLVRACANGDDPDCKGVMPRPGAAKP